jgi:hypothetical protein
VQPWAKVRALCPRGRCPGPPASKTAMPAWGIKKVALLFCQLRPGRRTGMGHERRLRDVRDKSGPPPLRKRLRQRSEPTLRATKRHSVVAGPNGTIEGTGL